MFSEVDIANMALQFLGAGTIASFSDNTPQARACIIAYRSCLLDELRENTWNFAIQRFELTQSATPPLFGMNYSYPLPTGFLRLLGPDPNYNYNDLDYQIESGQIYSNRGPILHVRCIIVPTDASLFDPSFCRALAAQMAMTMCQQITQSNEKLKDIEVIYQGIMKRAARANSLDKRPTTPANDTYLTSRI